MTKHNAENERIKRQYFIFLKQAKGQSEQSVDAVAKSLARFEEYNKYKDFKAFHYQQAAGFKNYLAEQNAQRSGERLSKATVYATLAQLKRFFQWLTDKPGYKSRLKYSDAEYFNLSDNDKRVATATREQKAPTLEQMKHIIARMPADTEIQRRNRAVVAFTLLTGARDSAIASMKLKHVDLIAGCVNQDAREVRTKFAKTFTTTFFPVGDEARVIVEEWVKYLRNEKLWGNDDPLFPATLVEVGASRQYEVIGLKRECWRNAAAIRKIFHEACENAGLPYFNPHSVRKTLVQLGQTLCKDPEAFKSWSQNLGHEGVMTTFFSYGEVSSNRQAEIIQGLAKPQVDMQSDTDKLAEAIVRKMRDAEVGKDVGL